MGSNTYLPVIINIALKVLQLMNTWTVSKFFFFTKLYLVQIFLRSEISDVTGL